METYKKTYMYKLKGFEVNGKEHMIDMLKKSQCAWRQTSKQWYKNFDSFMMSQGYKGIEAKHCTYICQFSYGNFVSLLLYVYDRLIVG